MPFPPATRDPRRRRGFTLIELMVVIVILGMLVALVGPSVWNALVTGTRGTAEAQMDNIKGAIEQYVLVKRSLPQTLEELTEPNDKTGYPFIPEIPNDPWGQPYEYKVINQARKEFEIRSSGDDKSMGTEDDLVWPKPKEQ